MRYEKEENILNLITLLMCKFVLHMYNLANAVGKIKGDNEL